jgi:hypothetical protein
MWDDVIGEPEGLRSPACAWNCSYKCFRGTKNCCYLLLVSVFAPCLAFCSAINFACLAFQVGKANQTPSHVCIKLLNIFFLKHFMHKAFYNISQRRGKIVFFRRFQSHSSQAPRYEYTS